MNGSHGTRGRNEKASRSMCGRPWPVSDHPYRQFFVVSAHREENIDSEANIRKLAGILIELSGDALGPAAVVIGIGLSSFAVPIARLIMPSLLQLDDWRAFYTFELGMALICLGCVFLLKLPPGDRFKTFEKLDFLTFAILATGVALLCAVNETQYHSYNVQIPLKQP